MARVCLACGDPLGANRTDEHVIADWLLKELGISAEQLSQYIADRITGETKNPRPQHPMDAFREGRVCETCNGGWMSVLESEAKGVLPVFMFTTERDFKTPDLRVIPGRLQSEEDALREQLREDWEYENETGIWPEY